MRRTNWKAVERNIRTASTIAWKRNQPLLESLAKRHLDRRSCSTEFLALLFHTVLFNEPQKSPDP
ncbi:sporulation initiation factor Spo0A C-terminal domain-containing protein [Flintibacter sp. HCN-6482]|uniref:sporulation initiation factor Spo0A C-terminal domain-containing protein n=1 Tax=Flintibacter sp. HCN-6482 TaxID=3134672 RepID=UPI0030BACD3B